MEDTKLLRYSRHVYFDPDEQEYVALCSEFPHISAFGETPEEALSDLTVALEGAIAVHREEGWPVPKPLVPPEPEALPSGKFVTRVPKTMHAQLVRSAKTEGVSLNTLVIALLAKGLAMREARAPGVDASAALQRVVSRSISGPWSSGPKLLYTWSLFRQNIESEWRDDSSDADDPDWIGPQAKQSAANEERAMVN